MRMMKLNFFIPFLIHSLTQFPLLLGVLSILDAATNGLALQDGMAWSPLGQVTNVLKVPPKETAPLLKVKNEEKEK